MSSAAVVPFRPSKVLTAFAAEREQQRLAERAQRERAAEMAAFRRVAGGRGTPRRQAVGEVHTSFTPPAFGIVAGERAFSAAGSDRLTAWAAVNTGINADLEGALSTLRARSRDWAMNTDAGERYIALVGDNLVGDQAPRLQLRAKLANGEQDEAANTAIEQAWADWCERYSDITGGMNFAQLCRTVAEGTARDGEGLAKHVIDRSLPYGYAVQLLDVDRIDTGMNVAPQVAGGNAVRLGVEIDRLGRPVAVWLHTNHPGDAGAGLGPKGRSGRVETSSLVHTFVRRRAEQVRGYPWAAAVLKRAGDLAQYESFAMAASRIGAAKMGFYVSDKDVLENSMSLEELKDATGELVQEVEAGMFEALPPGVSFESFDPDYPHANYGSFVGVAQRGIAAGLNVAHHNLSGDMNGVNYSSARIAELAERRHWRSLQRWLIKSFVRPVFEAWLRSALLTGAIKLPSGAALPAERFDKFARVAEFQPQGWAWVDPEADIKASAVAMSYDLRSARMIVDEQGVDLDTVLADKAALIKAYQAQGLPVPAWLNGAGAMTAGGIPQPSPAPAPQPKKETA